MKKILYISLLFFTLSFSQSYAIDTRVTKLYWDFSEKIESQYSQEKAQSIYMSLQDILSQLIFSNNLNITQEQLVQDMSALNNETLYEKWKNTNLWHANQQILELKQRNTLNKQNNDIEIPADVQNLVASSNIEYIAVNKDREFVKWWDIYSVNYTNYFSINQNPVSALKSKTGIVIPQHNGDFALIENYELKKKIPYSKLWSELLWFVIPEHKTIEKNGDIYAYNFESVRFFEDKYGVYQKELDSGGFHKNATLLYRDDSGRYNLVTNFRKHTLWSTSDFFGLTEKQLVLDYLREDSKFPSSNISGSLKSIKELSNKLTQGKNKEESIKAIYNWILENVSYSTTINLEDQQIFSAIETYKNSSWVCTGYTKLSTYLFLFAGIHDAEVVRWHVIDAEDFPAIWHAWIRIWDRYYDPTFDDPVGASETKTFDQYKYFGLPKDIFYANRFDYGTLPEWFDTKSDEEIGEHIFNYLTALLPKYKWKTGNYKVFAPVEFRNKYNIGAGTIVTPEVLAAKIWSYKVNNNSFKFSENWKTKAITWVRYYTLSAQNTQSVLDFLWYEVDDLYLFDWEVSPWNRQWRLAYELELN